MATAPTMPKPLTAWIGAAVLALALGGCAESTLVGHTAKSMFSEPQESVPQKGLYKVGNPYQIEGNWYTPREDYAYQEIGVASWYGSEFHGKSTANGERYDMNALTAAHRTLPMPSLVRVTNLDNGRSAILRINDRGPFARSRILDVSKRAADALGFLGQGTATVRVEILAEESVALKNRLLRGESDFGTPPTQVASLEAFGKASQVSTEELPPPTTGQVPAPVLAASAPSAAARLGSAPSAPVAPAATLVNGQYVQVGAFGDPANAERLRTQISALGPVDISPMQTSSGVVLHKVRLGPFADPLRAQTALAQAQSNGFPDARLVLP